MPTVVMVRDVATGQRIGPDDVAVATRPEGQRPRSVLDRVDAAVGRVVTTPLRMHDVVTSERLLGPDLLEGQPDDRVAISVPVLDAASVGVRPGNHVDLYATGSGSRAATDVVVLAVHDAEASTGLGAGAPARVTLALDPAQATEVARGLSALEAGQTLVVAIRHGSGSAQ